MDEQVLNNLPAFRAQYGVSRKTISTIETRRFTPSVVIALKLANYFNVPVETIFSLSSN